MAFNRETFKTRTLTAVVFVLIMAIGLFINHWLFFILFSIIHFGCWLEYQALIEKIYIPYNEVTPVHRYGAILAGWCFVLWMCNNAFSINEFTLHAIGLYIGMLLMVVLPVSEILFTKNLEVKNIFYSLGGFFYISFPIGLLMGIRTFFNFNYNIDDAVMQSAIAGGLKIVLCIIFSLWVNDTMAYITGSFIGKKKLSSISPKKTWEGTIGGIVCCVLIIGFLFAYILFPNYAKELPLYSWFLIAVIASISGTFGDLFESKLKRMAGVKDSGNIMPGHGGFLDRFDSLLFAVPFVSLLLLWFI